MRLLKRTQFEKIFVSRIYFSLALQKEDYKMSLFNLRIVVEVVIHIVFLCSSVSAWPSTLVIEA